MADPEARKLFSRLMHSATEADGHEAMNYIREAGLKILFGIDQAKLTTAIEKEMHLLFSMTMIKTDTVLSLSKGSILTNSLDGGHAPFIHDYFSIMAIVRTQFEAFCTFNCLFIHPKTIDEQNLFHSLWVVSGLKYRQRFETDITENQKKKDDEKQMIEKEEKEILTNGFFLSLDQTNQSFVLERLKNKEWQCYYDGQKVIKAGWQDLAIKTGKIQDKLMDQLYSSLSLSTHPSNVSVFQFDALSKSHDGFMVRLGVTLSRIFSAFLIADFARTNPSAKILFEDLPIFHQAFINMINRFFRSDAFVVNKAHISLLVK